MIRRDRNTREGFVTLLNYSCTRIGIGASLTKMLQFPGKLVILGPEEMKPILEWVVLHHGKDFTSLYDSV